MSHSTPIQAARRTTHQMAHVFQSDVHTALDWTPAFAGVTALARRNPRLHPSRTKFKGLIDNWQHRRYRWASLAKETVAC